ncbi:MAG: YsnF/AvaK domain-containing protein [Stellaceae bacterium]
MDGHNLVAVYSSRADAERVQDRLIAFGIPATGIRLSSASADTGAAAITESPHERHHSFWDWLFGDDVPEHDRGWYHTNLREGRTALSVLVRSDAEHEQVVEIMEEFNPVHMDDGTETGAAPVSMGAEQGEYARSGSSQMQAGAPGLTTEGEQVIPVVKEELAVGKRASERRYRVRTYVVETPVEEQVRLRDERVIVERRPASGAVGTDAATMQERVFEVTERHEEPVAEKRARQVEEVVVRKEADERVETVRDTVRETKVDVDQGPAERRENIGSTTPSNRNP